MPAGRPKQSNEIKRQRGTDQPSRMLPELPMEEKLSGLGNPPSHLTDRGKLIWMDFGRTLCDMGLLTRADIITFGMLCNEAGRWIQCENMIQGGGLMVKAKDENGNMIEKPNPLLKVQDRALANYSMLMNKLGIDPIMRQKLLAGSKSKDDGDGEDFA